jgi:hypothetical protein
MLAVTLSKRSTGRSELEGEERKNGRRSKYLHPKNANEKNHCEKFLVILRVPNLQPQHQR